MRCYNDTNLTRVTICIHGKNVFFCFFSLLLRFLLLKKGSTQHGSGKNAALSSALTLFGKICVS